MLSKLALFLAAVALALVTLKIFQRRADRMPAYVGAQATRYSSEFFQSAVVNGAELIFSRDGEQLVMRLADLAEIRVITTDRGPAVDDSFIRFRAMNGDAALVSLMLGTYRDLLQAVQSRPNFDNAALVAAMGRTDNSDVIVWKR